MDGSGREARLDADADVADEAVGARNEQRHAEAAAGGVEGGEDLLGELGGEGKEGEAGVNGGAGGRICVRKEGAGRGGKGGLLKAL